MARWHWLVRRPWLYLLYIGIGQYEKSYIGILSLSADKKIEFIGLYRYGPIRKKAYWLPITYTYFYIIHVWIHLLRI